MSFMLAGLAMGAGDGLQELAERRREEAERLLEEQNSRRSGGGSGGGGSRSSRTRAITRGMTGDIRSWAEDQGLDEDVISAFVTETERVLSQNPDWTENMAWEHVRSNAGRGEREVITQERRLFGLIPEEREMRPGNYDGTFTYPGEEPAGPPGGAAPVTGGGPAPQAATEAPAGFGAALGETPASPSVAGVGQQQAPQVGDIIEGYRFMGGDPADQNNWQRVQA